MPPLLALDDALTGSSIVGGIAGIASILYVLYDKVKTRNAKEEDDKAARTKKTSDDKIAVEVEQQKVDADDLKISELVRKTVSDAYEEANRVRKSAHDADVRALKRDIESAKGRLNELETSERRCQQTLGELTDKNCRQAEQLGRQAEQIDQQARQIENLKAEIAELTEKLKRAGALPSGTGPHAPL